MASLKKVPDTLKDVILTLDQGTDDTFSFTHVIPKGAAVGSVDMAFKKEYGDAAELFRLTAPAGGIVTQTTVLADPDYDELKVTATVSAVQSALLTDGCKFDVLEVVGGKKAYAIKGTVRLDPVVTV